MTTPTHPLLAEALAAGFEFRLDPDGCPSFSPPADLSDPAVSDLYARWCWAWPTLIEYAAPFATTTSETP